ncbi:MAG: hypothetical protein RDU14_15230 [Melioribacteraceae bacterium]|nr:hypothetical protein [Melioribacteraceae bacterium]
MERLIALFFISILLLGSCKKDEDNPVETTGWKGRFNSSGFPDVIGNYSFNTKQFMVVGTDGTRDVANALAMNVVVTQDKNKIMITNTDNSPSPGITILEATALEGNIEKDGKFITNQYATANFEGIQGNVRLTYNVTGQFTPNGWSGDYVYTASPLNYNVTYTFTTTFTGDKINSSSMILIKSEKVLNNQLLDMMSILKKKLIK